MALQRAGLPSWWRKTGSKTISLIQSIDTNFIPVVLTWTFAEEGIKNCDINVQELGNGSSVWNLRCICGLHGQGNPYFSDGCQAIGISMVILVLILSSFWLYKVVQKRVQETKRNEMVVCYYYKSKC